ncbi:hypothetical protein [Kangiella shandongensis]|uniref:hypothetical protein n=1 Tax=Kangiella shandongensis TaxID=2763258 RepID=UPI001CC10386|nr:hypothetical protein [Kangiella shandongensis]
MSKTFSLHAIDKINDIFENHDNHVGSELKRQHPDKYKDYMSSDCITMAIWVLKYAFEKIGKPDVASKVGTLGEKGTSLAKYLISHHNWNGVYYNPDVNHPLDGDGEHTFSYYNQVKKRCQYSVARVPVNRKVINYSPNTKKVNQYLNLTEKTMVNYNLFKKVPFGLGMSRGGSHVWLYSKGEVMESHWSSIGADLYTQTALSKFQWHSGIIVTPPDYRHLLSQISEVKCG